ncbi:phage tail assembly chaperone [Martelella limonii]|uniref:phage tail assembly chaperone n=1 Tax=Martelella limonii TaxID=1647649 RepID=UPI0015804968|nr:hypothetical protein [Martelella limonii]
MRNDQRLVEAVKRNLSEGRGVAIPAGGGLLWNWFLDLSRTRTWHSFGPNPISYLEVEAYCRLMRWEMRPDHIATLMAMDEAFIENTRIQQQQGRRDDQHSTRQLTAGLFDAIFG